MLNVLVICRDANPCFKSFWGKLFKREANM